MNGRQTIRTVCFLAALLGASVATAQDAEFARAYDFGMADSPVRPGFEQVTNETAYDAERGFGWEDLTDIKSSDKVNADDLQRDFVYMNDQSGALTRHFLVDLEPGEYWLALFAGDIQYSRGELPFDVLVNGEPAIEGWRNKRWELRVAPAQIAEGEQLRLTFRSSQEPDQRYSWWFVNALLVMEDVDTREQAHERAEALLVAMLEERYAEYEEVLPDPDPDQGEITQADRERGYVAFARDYLKIVWPGTTPSEDERRVTAVDFWATPGEYEPISFAVAPLKDLGVCRVEVTALEGDAGVLAADAWDVRIAGIMRRRVSRNEKKYLRAPKILYPGAEVEVAEGDTRWWWLTVRVPDDQPPGEYRGEVVFTPEGADPWRLELRLRVLPFRIEKPPGEVFGMYYGRQRAHFPERRAQHFADMREHLIDTITLSDESPSGGWEDGELTLDFNSMEEFIADAQAHGLTGPMPWGGVRRIEWLIPKDLPQDEWDARYQQLLAAVVAHGQEQGWPPLPIYPVDEPSKNQAKLERVEHRLGLARGVPGVLTYCTPNNIEGGKRIIHLLDYACWQHQSANADTRQTTLDNDGTFWYYSSNYGGATFIPRFRSGLLRWRLGAVGMFYWHYQCIVNDPFDDLDGGHCDMYVAAPGPDGPLPTLGWECEREGIEDHCALKMLERAIAAAPADKADEAAAAQSTIDEIRAGIEPDGKTNLSIPEEYSTATFHQYRRRIAEHLLKLL